MPRLAVEQELSDVESEGGDIPATEEAEVDEQVNTELRDDIEDAEAESDNGEAGKGGKEEDDEVLDEDADEDENEDEYVVEAIRGHKFEKGALRLEIKWVGYPETDNTWEPPSNLIPDASAILAKYYDKIGGEPQPPSKKRKSTSRSVKESPVEEAPTKRSKKNGTVPQQELGTWTPKASNWDSEVEGVDTMERDEDGKLWVFLSFMNGKKTKVGVDMVYKHCPLKMLRYYEKNLRFN